MPNRSDFRKAQKRGMGAVDMARLQHETDVLYATAIEEAAIQDASIACKVLAEEFWPKTAEKNIKKFLKEFWSQRSALVTGLISTADLAAYHKQNCNQEIQGKLFKITETGKIEKVQDIRNRRKKAVDLLKEAADALDGKATSPDLSTRIREYIDFLS